MLFKFVLTCFRLKMMLTGLMVHIQEHTRDFRYTKVYKRAEVYQSVFQHVYIALNIIILKRDLQRNKSILCIKNGMNSIHFSCTGSHKRFRISYKIWLETARKVFSAAIYNLFYFTKFECTL